MLQLRKPVWSSMTLAAFAASTLLALALSRIHIRSQTTLIGYRLGQLKSQEAKLLEERSTLKMQLAKMTTQKHLTLMTDATTQGVGEGTYALK